MFKAVKFVAVPASLSFATLRVHAASETKAPPETLLKVEELSLYSSPVPVARYVEDKKTELEEGISWLRTSTAPYTKWYQNVYEKVKPKVETAVEHSKGSRIKKIIYPLGFMGIGASLYYPQQAAMIAKDAGTLVYDWSLQGIVTVESLWKDGGKKKSSKKHEMPVSSDQAVSNDPKQPNTPSESSK
ncbi:hypothetical protein GDO78_008692 [Eleutherodactylus coqui]|uniref:MICOS complex subunit n=1 Tax=Eleutherodactylus coqui TaxID=57060 RepID=A0A8J6KAF1_ELECQ|nr:hypothetical protein GDO78_008692 [Eleutherodactylus coqui]